MLLSFRSQTVTASGTAGNFSLSLPSIAEGKESAWILADVVAGDVATDAEVKAAVEVIAGQVRHRAWLLPILRGLNLRFSVPVSGRPTHNKPQAYCPAKMTIIFNIHFT